VKTPTGYHLRIPSGRVEAGFNRRRLLRLTGLDAQENQARRLLADISSYRASLERKGEAPISDAALAGRWLSEVFEPSVLAVPQELRGKRAAAEVFHELLDHRWYMSEQAGRPVAMRDAVNDYITNVLREEQDERTAFLET
jgi:hypothetical protein